MDNNYNTQRAKLHMPEYGRHIQQMVDSIMTIEDRVERTKQAYSVIAVMGNLNPLLRDTADYTHKLWDHLYIISDFRLDVDSPYPVPTREELGCKPEKLDYPSGSITFKHYGRYCEQMINTIAQQQECEGVGEVMNNMTCFMRSKGYEYNQEHPNNEAIIRDIRQMSKGNIVLDEQSINNIQSDYKTNRPQHNPKQAKMAKKGRNINQKGKAGGYVKGFSKNNNSRRNMI